MAPPCKVLLLKAADDKYAAAFQRPTRVEQQDGPQNGAVAAVCDVHVHFVDVLTFEYVNTEALHAAVTTLDNYSGILVTSPRGAIAIVNAVQALRQQVEDGQGEIQYQQVLEKLRTFPIYSVGRATSRELEVLGVTCLGEESGSAELLAEHLHKEGVLSEESKAKPMLFTCGEKRSDVLPDSFRSRGLPLEELVVYKSCAVSDIKLPEDCAQPQWVAFFSPSGLKAMKSVDLPWASVRKAAIGKTTATTLRNYAEETGLKHWEADVVAAKPTADALADAIFQFEASNVAEQSRWVSIDRAVLDLPGALSSRVPVRERARDHLRGGHDEPAGEHEASDSVRSNMTTSADETSAVAQAMRERLLAANVLMRYDYAWKEVEFKRSETRVTGIVTRLLYHYAMWKDAVARHKAGGDATSASASVPEYKVFVEGSGYDAFTERCIQACRLMGFHVLNDDGDDEQAKYRADLVLIFIAPPGEERVDSQYTTFQSVVDHNKDTETTTTSSVDELPMFCFLLGEADFLAPPQDDEAERLRSLSEFAISQQLHPRMQDAAYASVAQFAVEFSPDASSTATDQEEKQEKLQQLMKGFGCVDHNLMHYTEKWEFYAHKESALCHEEEDEEALTQPSESESLFWLEYAKDKTCHFCHVATDKLSRCARCHDARYCSRECQRSAWKLHKRLCGKTLEEISS